MVGQLVAHIQNLNQLRNITRNAKIIANESDISEKNVHTVHVPQAERNKKN